LKRALAAVLTLSALFVGAWAAAAPASFYRDFPRPGHHWVSMLGPYNEHLIRDVGGLYLALFVITGWAALRRNDQLLRVAAAGWLVFGVLHLVFHATHLDMFPTADRIGMMVALGGTALLAALLLIPAAGTWSWTDRRQQASRGRSGRRHGDSDFRPQGSNPMGTAAEGGR
jgi:hypothetical protein